MSQIHRQGRFFTKRGGVVAGVYLFEQRVSRKIEKKIYGPRANRHTQHHPPPHSTDSEAVSLPANLLLSPMRERPTGLRTTAMPREAPTGLRTALPCEAGQPVKPSAATPPSAWPNSCSRRQQSNSCPPLPYQPLRSRR
jgi:hypothetical protein